MRKTVLALTLSLSLFGAAHAEDTAYEGNDTNVGQDSNFSACNTNEDCVIAEGICGNWLAINKTSEPVYDQFVRMMRGKGKCPEHNATPRPSAVFCTNKICQIPGQKAE